MVHCWVLVHSCQETWVLTRVRIILSGHLIKEVSLYEKKMLTFSPFYGEGDLMFFWFTGFVHHMFPIMISMVFSMCFLYFFPICFAKGLLYIVSTVPTVALFITYVEPNIGYVVCVIPICPPMWLPIPAHFISYSLPKVLFIQV
jgi:hypothetical protein